MRLSRTPAAAKPSDHLLAFGGIAAVVLLIARILPVLPLPSVCGLRNATGLPCPTCGMTRAFVRVTHGELAAAFQVSPLGTALCFGAIGLVAWTVLRLTVVKRGFVLTLSRREKRGWAIAAGVVLATNWVYLLVTGAAT